MQLTLMSTSSATKTHSAEHKTTFSEVLLSAAHHQQLSCVTLHDVVRPGGGRGCRKTRIATLRAAPHTQRKR